LREDDITGRGENLHRGQPGEKKEETENSKKGVGAET